MTDLGGSVTVGTASDVGVSVASVFSGAGSSDGGSSAVGDASVDADPLASFAVSSGSPPLPAAPPITATTTTAITAERTL
jgi:hypothetical protein